MTGRTRFFFFSKGKLRERGNLGILVCSALVLEVYFIDVVLIMSPWGILVIYGLLLHTEDLPQRLWDVKTIYESNLIEAPHWNVKVQSKVVFQIVKPNSKLKTVFFHAVGLYPHFMGQPLIFVY